MPERPTTTLEELLDACSPSGRHSGCPPLRLQPAGDGAAGRLEISSLAYDSRRVQPGALFFCVPGGQHDGHRFAADAVRRGAVALVVERALGLGVPEVRTDSVRGAMGPLAACFYGDPSARLRLAGVTGTNGKTTSAFLLRAMLERAGVRCGLLGTVKSVIGGRERGVAHTTPEAIDLQAELRAMVDAGDGACVMEVSSHALAMGRTSGARFAVAIFTNLTQDHLDFHADMEDYFQAKRRLFTPAAQIDGASAPQINVVNVDDPYGRRLAAELDDVVTFAVESGHSAQYRASDVRCHASGSEFRLQGPDGERVVTLPMPGRFNIANALGALGAARALGVELDAALAALVAGVRVPGRLEPVDEGQGFAVLVDYAHTPDSLERVLAAARELSAGAEGARVVCVFGAGGDRDRGKRPLMGAAGARGAELVIVTSDNPRSEEPQAIIEEIMAGVRKAQADGAGADAEVLLDRREAIERAIALARSGDVVVLAGKGHERGQQLAGGRVVPFDDVAVARAALRRGGGGASPGVASRPAYAGQPR